MSEVREQLGALANLAATYAAGLEPSLEEADLVRLEGCLLNITRREREKMRARIPTLPTELVAQIAKHLFSSRDALLAIASLCETSAAYDAVFQNIPMSMRLHRRIGCSDAAELVLEIQMWMGSIVSKGDLPCAFYVAKTEATSLPPSLSIGDDSCDQFEVIFIQDSSDAKIQLKRSLSLLFSRTICATHARLIARYRRAPCGFDTTLTVMENRPIWWVETSPFATFRVGALARSLR